MNTFARIFVLLIGLVLLTGCGNRPKAHPVEGQLKFTDGSVPMFGNIEFYHAEHKINARGKINRDGTFSVGTYSDNDGAVEGTHQIVIIQNTGNHLATGLNEIIDHDHGALVDPSYFDYRTSVLTCRITRGTNQVHLILEKNPNQTEDGLPEN